jgi:hypothetical protein
MNRVDKSCSPHEHLVRDIAFDSLRTYLRQVVTIHQAMFQKLLFQNRAVPEELSELFADAGRTYLEIARELARYHEFSDSMLNNILKPES